jgi:hypothetical protein
MHRKRPAWKASTNHFFAAVTASIVLFTAGCANMATTAADSYSLPGNAAVVSGQVHGGSQPINNATVTLNSVGTVKDGSAGLVLATAYTNSSGGFSFTQNTPSGGTTYPNTSSTYTCPGSGNPLVYLKAVGGNTANSGSTTSNPAIVFLAPLGLCSTIGTTVVNVTEATTVATVAALQQYIDPVNEVIGSGSSGEPGTAIVNSFNLIKNLVNPATGLAVNSTTFNGGNNNGVSGTSITATPTYLKINTIANILSACINGASSGTTPCGTLFADAVPASAGVTNRSSAPPVAADVLQAVYNMLTNPTSGGNSQFMTDIFNLPVGVGQPFGTGLTNAPKDWTIAIQYSSASPCGGGNLISSPASLSVDINGNIWFADAQTGSGNLVEVTSTGTPGVCVALNPKTGLKSSVSTTIDTHPYVWQGSSDSLTLSRWSPTGTTTVTATEAPLALAADGVGNVYFSTVNGNLFQIPNATAGTPGPLTEIFANPSTGMLPTGLFIDSSISPTTAPQTGAIWMTSGNGTITRTAPSTATTDPNISNGFTTTIFQNTPSPTYGIAVSPVITTSTTDPVTHITTSLSTNNVYTSIPNTSPANPPAPATTSSVANYVGLGTSYQGANGWSTSGAGGLNNPFGIALDGIGNIWTANNGNDSITEISAAGAALSPAGGFLTGTGLVNSSRSIVVDQSGNVWIAGDGNNFITELVGAAVPVYQPYSTALSKGLFQTIP